MKPTPQKLADVTFTAANGRLHKRYTVRRDPRGSGFALWDKQHGSFLYSPSAPYATREEAVDYLHNTTEEKHGQQRKMEFIDEVFHRRG
jgi:hypothetical protein